METTHVLGSPEGNTSDTGDLLQSETKESFPGLSLRARLDFVQSGLGSGILIVVVVVVMIVIVVVVIMVRVVGVDFFDGCGHLVVRWSANSQ